MRGWRGKLIVWATVALVTGCEEDPMRQGMAAVLSGNAEVAEASFKKVLKADPKNAEARRMMAEVHRLKKDYPLAEEVVRQLLLEHGLDGERALTTEEKSLKKRLDQQLNEIYTEWVETLNPTQDAEKFEEIAKRGVAHNPRSTRINTLLVEFYFDRAERLIEKGDKEGAATALENVSLYPGLPEQRSEAQTRAGNLRLEIFGEAVQGRVEANQSKWQTESRWVDTRKALQTRVTLAVDRKLNPKVEADLVEAKKLALPQVRTATIALVEELTGVAIDPTTGVKHHVADESFVRGEYAVNVMVSVDEAKRLAFEAQKTKKAPADENPPAVDAPDSGQSEDGSTAD